MFLFSYVKGGQLCIPLILELDVQQADIDMMVIYA